MTSHVPFLLFLKNKSSTSLNSDSKLEIESLLMMLRICLRNTSDLSFMLLFPLRCGGTYFCVVVVAGDTVDPLVLCCSSFLLVVNVVVVSLSLSLSVWVGQ
jgi:hypothetical protein